ncbi:MAG: biotin transporter BioY [Pseudobutyrivibrio sp.]|nr:biotin transporter BioY [Pseudobutyrivibrio sp.]
MTKSKFATRDVALTGLMAAVICICGPLSIPIGVIPVSLTPFAIMLAVEILGRNRGTMACLIYLLIGLVGLPVFSGFSGGVGKLFGPTGGFLFSFAFMTLIAGTFIDKFSNVIMHMLGGILGLIFLYAIGTLWLSFQASMTIPQALAAAVIPFVPMDIAKIVLAVLLGKAVKERIKIFG